MKLSVGRLRNDVGRANQTTQQIPAPLPPSITNLTWTETGSNPGLRWERPTTSHLSHGTGVEVKVNLIFFLYRTVNTVRVCYARQCCVGYMGVCMGYVQAHCDVSEFGTLCEFLSLYFEVEFTCQFKKKVV